MYSVSSLEKQFKPGGAMLVRSSKLVSARLLHKTDPLSIGWSLTDQTLQRKEFRSPRSQNLTCPQLCWHHLPTTLLAQPDHDFADPTCPHLAIKPVPLLIPHTLRPPSLPPPCPESWREELLEEKEEADRQEVGALLFFFFYSIYFWSRFWPRAEQLWRWGWFSCSLFGQSWQPWPLQQMSEFFKHSCTMLAKPMKRHSWRLRSTLSSEPDPATSEETSGTPGNFFLSEWRRNPSEAFHRLFWKGRSRREWSRPTSSCQRLPRFPASLSTRPGTSRTFQP